MKIREEDFKKIRYYGKYEVIYSVRTERGIKSIHCYFNKAKNAKKLFNDINKFVNPEFRILKRYK